MQFKIFKNDVIQGISEVSFGSIRNHQRAIRFLKSFASFIGLKR